MSDISGDYWPEQEVIRKWFKEHEIDVPNISVVRLASKVTEYRNSIQSRLDAVERLKPIKIGEDAYIVRYDELQQALECKYEWETERDRRTLAKPEKIIDCPKCKRFVCVCPIASMEHDSDCAVHNAPAYPKGKCDCSLSQALEDK